MEMNCSLEFQWSVRHVNVYSSGNRVTRDESATPPIFPAVRFRWRTFQDNHEPEQWGEQRPKMELKPSKDIQWKVRKSRNARNGESRKAISNWLHWLTDGTMCLAFVISISLASGWVEKSGNHSSININWYSYPKTRSGGFFCLNF